VSERVVAWMVGLNQHATRQFSTPRAPGYLRNQLKGPLGGPEVGQGEPRINRDDADQRDVVKIVSLRQHLCADQQIQVALAEIEESLFELMPPRLGIAIYAANPQPRKTLAQQLLDLFSAFADVVDVLAAAGRTRGRSPLTMITVMTHQRLIGAVISQRHVAIRTLDRFAARASQDEARITTPIQEDD